MLKRALIVGYGSIGARHARLLTELGCRTAVVSKREVDFPVRYADLGQALTTEQPDYVVIANATNQHHATLLTLVQLSYTGTVLVEKPLFSDFKELGKLPFKQIFVAYNLRFHPIIQRLKHLLKGEEILSAQAYVGQYLPDWRPATDYRESYSAKASQGGGALRDLSHELDYLLWMLGGWQKVSALGGHLSPLEISSDDVFALMMTTLACPIAMLQLNYLDKLARRTVLINTANHTIEADLIKGIVTLDRQAESFTVGRDDTYRAMHEAMISGRSDSLCSLTEGLEVMRLIAAAEKSATQEEWIKR
jgi:predicted dehydrogenase